MSKENFYKKAKELGFVVTKWDLERDLERVGFEGMRFMVLNVKVIDKKTKIQYSLSIEQSDSDNFNYDVVDKAIGTLRRRLNGERIGELPVIRDRANKGDDVEMTKRTVELEVLNVSTPYGALQTAIKLSDEKVVMNDRIYYLEDGVLTNEDHERVGEVVLID